MKVPFNDLTWQWRHIEEGVRSDFDRVFASSQFSSGPFVEAFERQIAEWLGVPHAIGVNSGTSALHLALLSAGVRSGDEVLLPAHTFIGSAWGILYIGAIPVFCDVDDETGTIDVEVARRLVTPRTRAVVPVHLYGQPANMDAVLSFALDYDLKVIEDAAQSIGATWNGRSTGSLGELGCISFYPGKNLGAAGEAGLIVTSDDRYAGRLRSLRNHAQTDRYVHAELGFNYRMDGLQAVVLTHKLPLLSAWTKRRTELANQYIAKLEGLPLEIPSVRHQTHCWHLFVVRTPSRNLLRDALSKSGIETGLHYPVPLHRQPAMSAYVKPGTAYPVSDRWADEGLSLPLFVGMTDEQLDYVVKTVATFYR
ncbi:DegT/DnrJ/EryC1/StrS aminotransferase family protein [Bradyrhizobium sp. WSM1417]|uniref:DegT/DnrJ/EryC1/StrS family aminotransferase n=1 Tax=Bradyrhizobium sp. WSM1417 TaxID=754500 RepID=UPI000487AB6D|nr:DegT/DnrJ/EryC1/StrS family aminotransferase [Bradyrhizobium sp. WSM1417]